MFPDQASLFLMGVDDRQHVADKKAFWHTRQLVRCLRSPCVCTQALKQRSGISAVRREARLNVP